MDLQRCVPCMFLDAHLLYGMGSIPHGFKCMSPKQPGKGRRGEHLRSGIPLDSEVASNAEEGNGFVRHEERLRNFALSGTVHVSLCPPTTVLI